MTSLPMFAVVGHPNKGKSSIVATLAGDDSVRIGSDPGTTSRCRHYPMKVDGKALYALVDTPGFQRPHKALQWMEEHETTAAKHPDVVRQFVEAHRGTNDYPDECELLGSIVDGAGILYVVDGSVPYGPEYEAEMKILLWTGRPRMGLINPIGTSDYIDDWRTALGQYFSVVRVFNAMHSGFHKRIELLRAFGELQENWRPALDVAARSLQADREQRRKRAADVLADTLCGMLTHSVATRLRPESDIDLERTRLVELYDRDLRRMEAASRDRIEELYDHNRIDREEPALAVLRADELFSEQTWSVFGLGKRQLLGLGAVGGAAAGGMVDAAVGGTSFFLGALVGSAVGAASSYWGGRKLAETKIQSIPLGGKQLVVLPSRNVNFPHVVFNRARVHHALIAGRTHAERGALDLRRDPASVVAPLSDAQRRSLEQLFRNIRRGVDSSPAAESLSAAIASILEQDDQARPNGP